MAWKRPNTAMEIRYATKKLGSKNANANVIVIRAMKMFHMPAWAYSVQMRTTVLESSMSAAFLSRFMFFLMYSTARKALVVTACIDSIRTQEDATPSEH